MFGDGTNAVGRVRKLCAPQIDDDLNDLSAAPPQEAPVSIPPPMTLEPAEETLDVDVAQFNWGCGVDLFDDEDLQLLCDL